MRELSNYTYEFGSFRFEPGERRLLRDGQPVLLTPKAFDTLVVLVERAGWLVEKEELMSALWPDSFVEEANLTQQVSTLRKALGETGTAGSLIETVPKKGFRFVGAVTKHSHDTLAPTADGKSKPTLKNVTAEPLSEPAPVASEVDFAQRRVSHFLPSRRILIALLALAAVASLVGFGLSRRHNETALSSPKTIAVLPFKPLSSSSRDESLELGMAETLITRLSNIHQIVVRPMTSVRKYTDPQADPVKIGQEVQAEAVLDGSIQKADGRVRITVRLTDVRNGRTLWAEQFDESFSDIFKVQDSISDRVARALPLRLSSEESMRLAKRYTESPEAYERYLHAQYLWNIKTPENLRRMSEDYDAAIATDPRFALAYVGRAELEISRFGTIRARLDEVLPKIVANLTKALELDDSLAEAHNTLAEIKYQFEFDWTGAEKEFKKAIELNANVATIRLAYGWYLMDAGRFDQAMVEMQRAQELDPSSNGIKRVIGKLFYYSRQYDRAIQHFQLMIDAEPKVAANHGGLALAYMQKGMYAETVNENATAAMINAEDSTPEEIESYKETFRKEGWQSYLRRQQARMLRREKEKYTSPYRIAFNYAQLGEKDEAFVRLNKAIDERAAGVAELKIDPGFDALRSDPRFVKLLERVNLSP